MKTQKGIREHDTDELRKAKRLEPLRKSGKDRNTLYNRYDEEEEEYLRPKRESAFDYLDDEEVAPDDEASLADEDDEDDDFDFEDDEDDETPEGPEDDE